ncbi:MAG: hypothetical protein K6G34_15105 [Lachnospiraceae bacterium]|nr:hypothetical protein [Lachnospiraceae bacterium]
MSTYALGEDEVVIMEDHNVSKGISTVSLILTNRNLIQVSKVFRGASERTMKFSLLDLKEQDGKPNVLIGKGPDKKTRLDLYFDSYELHYSFQGLFGEKKWAAAIEKAYKACVTDKKRSEKKPINLGELFTPLKDTVKSAKKAVIPINKEPTIKTMKCPRCGAELTGEKGTEVQCSYCEALIRIK